MVSGNRISGPPLRPPGAGPDPRASCDFLGSCPRRTPLVGFLGGFIDEANVDFDEFLRVIGLDDSSEDQFNEFLELIEYIDNQRW
jgi:hypothetical protein